MYVCYFLLSLDTFFLVKGRGIKYSHKMYIILGGIRLLTISLFRQSTLFAWQTDLRDLCEGKSPSMGRYNSMYFFCK